MFFLLSQVLYSENSVLLRTFGGVRFGTLASISDRFVQNLIGYNPANKDFAGIRNKSVSFFPANLKEKLGSREGSSVYWNCSNQTPSRSRLYVSHSMLTSSSSDKLLFSVIEESRGFDSLWTCFRMGSISGSDETRNMISIFVARRVIFIV